jgi:hypothetical protein
VPKNFLIDAFVDKRLRAMKKNKNPRGNGLEPSDTVEMIAPEALQSLASKLKADLAKPAADPKSAPLEKSKRRKEQKSDKQSKIVEDKPLQKKNKAKVALKGELKGQQVANGHTAKDQHKPDQKSKGSKKTKRKGGAASQSANVDEKSNSTTAKKSAKPHEKGHGREDSKSLLDEILALGGTKEDLELIEDISSDEDLVDHKGARKGKSDEDSVFSRPSKFV